MRSLLAPPQSHTCLTYTAPCVVWVQATLNAAGVNSDGSISLGSFRGGGVANQLFNGGGKALDAWTSNADNGRTNW